MSTKIDPNALSFRIATVEDAIAIEKLVQLAYRGGKATVEWKNEDHLVKGPRITVDEVISAINRSGNAILIAEFEKTIAACVQVEAHDGDAHIGLLAVNPDYQNLGLGKKMVARAEQYGAEHFHCTTGAMFVLSGRDELLNWYRSLGYELTGHTEPFHGPHTPATSEENKQTPVGENPHFREIKKPFASVSILK